MKYTPILLGTRYILSMHPNPSQNQFAIAIPSIITNAKPPPHTSPLPSATPTPTNKAPAPSTRTRTATKKKNETAADELFKQVTLEKKKRELKKKQRAAEKRAVEETKKKTDQEKKMAANAGTVIVSPPLTINEGTTPGTDEEDERTVANINEEKDDKATLTGVQTVSNDWTDEEDDEVLARHGISPNHLFGKDPDMTSSVKESTGIDEDTTVDLTAAENSPEKKKTKNTAAPSGLKMSNRYTTKSFSVAKIAHNYTHPRTFVEAAITLTSDEKPKEFIAAIKLLLTNGQILDPNFGLTPLKMQGGVTTKTKLITTADDVPVNFTHLGQYAFTTGNQIFEKKKDWKGANDYSKPNKKADHRDNPSQPELFKNPVVYFTIAIATDIPPHSLINGIRTEWEANGGGKLSVKELQSQESKVVMALYFVYTGTPYHIILKTLKMILSEATSIKEHERMALEGEFESDTPAIPDISIRLQIPRLKGVDTSSYDKLPYHVRENRKVLHIETDPENEALLKELIQFAKERNVLSLLLGKRARISEVMDTTSTPGEIKKAVRTAMKHAGYQGSMTGETIFGIDLIDGEVAPSLGGGKVSLRMVMFNYIKMQADEFSLFAELHQVEEMGPTLAIFPACEEAERMVHSMYKQVAAFLFHYLTTIAALPSKFVRELLEATCDATLVSEIDKCEWNPETLTITTPHEKKEEDDIDELEKASWWNNAFDLREIGKKDAKRAANKKPEKLFDLENDALSFATVHNRHLQPTFDLDNDKEGDDSEGSASAANPSPATPPRKNPNQGATRTNKASSATAPLPSEEVEEGDVRAAGGG